MPPRASTPPTRYRPSSTVPTSGSANVTSTALESTVGPPPGGAMTGISAAVSSAWLSPPALPQREHAAHVMTSVGVHSVPAHRGQALVVPGDGLVKPGLPGQHPEQADPGDDVVPGPEQVQRPAHHRRRDPTAGGRQHLHHADRVRVADHVLPEPGLLL